MADGVPYPTAVAAGLTRARRNRHERSFNRDAVLRLPVTAICSDPGRSCCSHLMVAACAARSIGRRTPALAGFSPTPEFQKLPQRQRCLMLCPYAPINRGGDFRVWPKATSAAQVLLCRTIGLVTACEIRCARSGGNPNGIATVPHWIAADMLAALVKAACKPPFSYMGYPEPRLKQLLLVFEKTFWRS